MEIKDLKRLRAGNSSDTSNIILVSLASKVERDRVLKRCRRHELQDEFKLVFAREDRSPAEQADFNRARKLAGRRNGELRARLDNPFRFVVHRGTHKVVLIDVIESGRQRKYVFKEESDLELVSQEASAAATSANRSNRSEDVNDTNDVNHIVQLGSNVNSNNNGAQHSAAADAASVNNNNDQ